jgi:hypothetical protein
VPINYSALATELQSDPRGYGFRALISIAEGGVSAGSTNDEAVAVMLNVIRAGTAGTVPASPTADGGAASGIISLKRPTVPRVELMNCIDSRDLKALPTVLEGSILESILQADSVTLLNDDGTNNVTRGNLNRFLSDANGSQTRLNAVSKLNSSRFAEKFGFGSIANNAQVGQALRG